MGGARQALDGLLPSADVTAAVWLLLDRYPHLSPTDAANVLVFILTSKQLPIFREIHQTQARRLDERGLHGTTKRMGPLRRDAV